MVDKDNSKLTLIGEVEDTIIYKDGRREVLSYKNTMLNNFLVLVAALIKRESQYLGANYWAIGSGTEDWDRPPSFETINLNITKAATATGNILITLNGVQFQVPINQGDSIQTITTKISQFAFNGWKVTLEDSTNVRFIANQGIVMNNHSFNGGTPTVQATLSVLVHGRPLLPRPEANRTETKLVSEIFRKPIQPSDMTFLDSGNLPTETPTNKIQISVTFEANEAIGSWREFSIFGGNASSTKDTGLAINKKNHALINKTNEMVVERKIRFTFI